MPLQFAWKDLRTVIFEFDAGDWYDRSMPYMFGVYCICLFLGDMSFRKSGLLSNTTPRFLADAYGFVSWNRIKHGELFKIFSRRSPTRIKLQLRPCHPGRHGHYTMLQLLKRFLIEIWKFEYHRHRDGGLVSKSFIKVSLLFHKDHSEFELRETHIKIFKTYIKT